MNDKQTKAVRVIKAQLKRLKPRTKRDKQAIEYMQVMVEYLLTGEI